MNKIIAMLSLFLLPLHAASAPSDSEIDQLMPLSLDELLAVNVSISTHSKQQMSKAPSVVSVITAEDIKATGTTNLMEILQSVPGVAPDYRRQLDVEGLHIARFHPSAGAQAGQGLQRALVGRRLHRWRGMRTAPAQEEYRQRDQGRCAGHRGQHEKGGVQAGAGPAGQRFEITQRGVRGAGQQAVHPQGQLRHRHAGGGAVGRDEGCAVGEDRVGTDLERGDLPGLGRQSPGVVPGRRIVAHDDRARAGRFRPYHALARLVPHACLELYRVAEMDAIGAEARVGRLLLGEHGRGGALAGRRQRQQGEADEKVGLSLHEASLRSRMRKKRTRACT
jgi:hypothetical protein